MDNFLREIQVRWADMDPNFHLRHSVYYDWGALSRIEFLYAHGLTASLMQQLHVGPIIFREECVFKKEIRFGDKVAIDLKILQSRRDFSRWTIQHSIIKNNDTVAAVLTVDGAWLDTALRKLTVPPPQATDAFSKMSPVEGFHWLD